MSSVIASEAYALEAEQVCQGNVEISRILSSEDYINAMSAVKPIFELITNSLFSDAVKSVKSKKDQLAVLPEILDRLYSLNSGLQSPAMKKPESTNSTNKSPKSNLITLNKECISNSLTPSIKDGFETLQLNRTNSLLRQVIYFKEYSYPLFFNTFIKNLHEVLNTKFKTKLAVFEQPGSRINLRRYDDMFFIDFDAAKSKISYSDIDRLAVFQPSRNVLEQLCLTAENDEILIIYDKSGIDSDMICGSKVRKFNLVKSSSDLRTFRLNPEQTVSGSVEGVVLCLSEIEKYKEITNESIKKKLIRKKLVEPFLSLIE